MNPKTDDFVSSIVPDHERKPWFNILFVWLGFIIVVGIMAVGGGMASQMSQNDFIYAVISGNIILSLFALVSGYIGADSGKTFNQLMSDAFPGKSWRIVSLYVPVVLIGWFGVEAAIFGNLIGEIFELSTGYRRLMMSIATLVFAVTTYLGFKAIRIVSVVAVPTIVVIGIFAIYIASGKSDVNFGFSDISIDISQGIAIVMGSWIMGVLTCVPDLTRFSRSKVSGALVAATGILIGNTFTFIIGGVAAALAGEYDPAKVLLSFGFIPLAILLSLTNIWTTNDNNMYSAALNVARFGNVNRRKAVVICALIAAVFASFDPTSIGFLFTFLAFMGNTAPALGGVVLGSYLWNKFSTKRVQNVFGAWLGWLIGSFIGFLTGGIWAIPAGFFMGFIIWSCIGLVMSKMDSKSISTER